MAIQAREPVIRETTPENPDEFFVVGKRKLKYDYLTKATGATKYAADIKLPRMCFGMVLRSPYPHARILRVDTTRAEHLDGVYAVISGADLPEKYGIMPSSQDETTFAIDKARYMGEAVAAVAAVDELTAERACGLIDVLYEPLIPITSIDDALDASKPTIHQDQKGPANVHKEVHLEFGDVEEGFAQAAYVREDEFFFEGNTHAAMENHAAIGRYEPHGKLTVWSSTQTPHYLHRELSKALSMPAAQIRIIAPPSGGAFGGKSEMFAHEVAAAALSRKCGRPVLIELSREEVFYCHRGRHPVRMKLKMGVTKAGAITAMHFQSWLDGGAFGSYGVATTYYTGALNTMPYKVPSYRFDGVRVFTNKPPCGPKRGHGTVQPRFAIECQLDKIAEALDLDPVELRIRNAVDPNSSTVNGLRITSCAVRDTLRAASEATSFAARHRKLSFGKGIGIASSVYMSGAGLPIYWNPMPHSGAMVKIDRGGGVTVYCGTADIGQDSDSMLAYIVSEVLGVEPIDVRVVSGDTDLAPVDLGSYSSRVTFMAGNAARTAADKLRDQLADVAAAHLGVPKDRLRFGDRRVYDAVDTDRNMSFVDAAQQAEAVFGTLAASGSYTPPKLGGDYKGSGVGPSPAYSFTTAVAEVTVDPETYELSVNHLTVAHDCGRAINPMIVEGQIEGSAYMGFGEALMEEQVFRKGVHKKPSLLEYKIPTILETPEIRAIIVEGPDAEGPFGAKEAGEGPLSPVIPAIANAVYDAIGVRFDATPITSEKIMKAMARHESEEKQHRGNSPRGHK
ncbi:MAG TPA: molybdopterin cofactor-binding domain-containing protein [Chloroflexota bacterium]|nr:molybdopterin cofactor-binding domain-containing protein [Chloroflexota bacterium]